MNSCGSLIRNKWYLWEDTALPQTDFASIYNYRANNYQYQLISYKYTPGIGIPSTSFTTCSYTSITSTPCFSITIETSTFSKFGSMKTVSTSATFVDPTYNMKFYGTILDLDNYFGPIKLYRNTFSNNVLQYSSCNTATAMNSAIFSGTDNYPVYGTKSQLQIRSLLSVIYHYH